MYKHGQTKPTTELERMQNTATELIWKPQTH